MGGGGGNNPPVADAGADQSGQTGDVLTFDGTGSFDPDGDPISYAWDFGDGATDTGSVVTHSYAAAGTYIVTLTGGRTARPVTPIPRRWTITDPPSGETVYLTIVGNQTPRRDLDP